MQVQPKVMNARHLTSGKRKKETIEQISKSNKDDNYRPKPGSKYKCSIGLNSSLEKDE